MQKPTPKQKAKKFRAKIQFQHPPFRNGPFSFLKTFRQIGVLPRTSVHLNTKKSCAVGKNNKVLIYSTLCDYV
jgi:hypothetical protein